MTQGPLKYLAIACLALPCLAEAIQVSDLHLPMTRTEADNTLTKDYDFTVLEDSSVRRQWHTKGRRIAVDFDILTDQAICIRITYDTPVSRKEAEADVEKLCGKTGGKWSKTKKKAVQRIGISEKSLVMSLGDGALLFLEGSNKKFTRISYFAKPPKSDRWQLSPMSTGGHVTAMGSTSNSDAGAARAMIQDEERRKNSSPSAVASVPTTPSSSSSSSGKSSGKGKHTSSSTHKPSTTPTERPSTPTTTPSTPRKRPAAVVVRTPAPDEFSTGESVTTIEEVDILTATGLSDFSYWAPMMEELDEAEDFREKIAIIRDRVPTSQMYAAGVLLLILLLVLWGAIAKMRNKARARANYRKIVGNAPAPRKAAKETPADTADAPAGDAEEDKQDTPQ